MKTALAALAVLALAGCSDSKPAAAPAPTAPPAAAPAKAAYPMDTCPVSGEKLGAMGDPVVYEYEGKEIRFCCGSCVKEFNKDPKKYMAMVDAARAKK